MAGTGRLAGRIALVTGAGSGIGLGIGRRFAAEGATVLFTDIDGGKARAAAADHGGQAATLDVTSETSWAEAAELVEKSLGGLHILVNNAGICVPGSVEDTDFAAWRRSHAINLDGVFLGCHSLLPLMAKTTAATGSGGAILNISSVSAMVASANFASYNSSKAAVRHLGKALAREWARRGISVNIIQPGYFESEMTADLFGSEAGKKFVASFPRQRLRPPSDLHAPLLLLCSDAAQGITGSMITIDDGQTL